MECNRSSSSSLTTIKSKTCCRYPIYPNSKAWVWMGSFSIHCARLLLILHKNFRCRNRIREPEALSCLRLCARLIELNLRDNPIAKLFNYQECVGAIVPNLLIIEGRRAGGNRCRSTDQTNLPEFSSSLSSSLSRNIDNTNSSSDNGLLRIDPLSSTERNSETVLLNRPSTAGDARDARELTFDIHAKKILSYQIHSAIRIFRFGMVMQSSVI